MVDRSLDENGWPLTSSSNAYDIAWPSSRPPNSNSNRLRLTTSTSNSVIDIVNQRLSLNISIFLLLVFFLQNKD